MNKEMMSGVLAGEILGGSIRALFCVGANPANALPDQVHAVRALESLDLLVTSDAVWSETARLAHYVFGPTQPCQRPDHTYFAEELALQVPFAQFTPAMVDPQPGFEVVDDWYVYYALAKRLGLPLRFAGRDLSMTDPPSSEDLLAMLVHRAVSLDELRLHPSGAMFKVDPSGLSGRASPLDDLMSCRWTYEPRSTRSSPRGHPPRLLNDGTRCTHLLVSRRSREVMNSSGRALGAIRRRLPYNAAYINPADLPVVRINDGGRVQLRAEADTLQAIMRAAASIRPRVVSMTHGWGRLPRETEDDEGAGSSTTRLIARDRSVESISAMPRLSAPDRDRASERLNRGTPRRAICQVNGRGYAPFWPGGPRAMRTSRSTSGRFAPERLPYLNSLR